MVGSRRTPATGRRGAARIAKSLPWQRSAASLALAAGVLALGCDAFLGLGQFQQVDCLSDCPESGADGGNDVGAGSPDASDGGHHAEGSVDADAGPGASADADADASGGSDLGDGRSSLDVVLDAPVVGDGLPSPEQVWAHWPMPNPAAPIAPDASTPLPNPMAYDACADGSVYDLVTHLTWQASYEEADDLTTAQLACQALGMRLPTRIELVSLVDFTTSPAISSAVFPATPTNGTFWTSSVVWTPAGTDASTLYWTVNFYDGLVQTEPPHYVRCVSGGAP
jgi:hypothetical protein